MGSTGVIAAHVTSRDGTRIGYLRRGAGPGLVLIQGAMGTAYHYHDLANALAPDFTVYTPDRRGRGLSPKPYDDGHDIARDVEDVAALLTEADTGDLFGLSSGAMITLEAARTLRRVTRAAVYEPPFYRDGISHDGIRQLGADLEHGHLAAALAGSLRTARTAPAPLRMLPRPAARLLAAAVLSVDARRAGPAPKLRDLLPGIRYDFNVVAGMDAKMASFGSIDQPMLLLSGTKSPGFLRQAIHDLSGVLPRATTVEFDGLDHAGSWNTGRGSGPRLVAAALRAFFT
ncbi:alpha/beta fold hydrolase [Actinoplanes sp. L3-i22]|uniref:alpha/beta fold hydrolase n=1 Tax=Actinoplanes sp. L3-i22 TaxID=2836373 RepID=UPI001C743F95|nr:alpha/beta hydrolase [Actinoplanes sp. L3-i22]BCY09173.1 alpha/beta hydrolase [Actinoplanes sp. L3-i22]